jgi:kynurenine formamidase
MKYVLFIVLSVIISGCEVEQDVQQQPFANGRWIDLSHEYSAETLYWPTSPLFALDTVFVGQTDGGWYYEAYSVTTAEHGGTHLDSPIHFAENRMATHELTLDQLTGEAAVINVSDVALTQRDYQVSVEDIQSWEAANNTTVDGKIILIHTGSSSLWPDAEAYLGTALRGQEGVAALNFPGIHPDTAQWLVDNRTIKAIGLDTPSLDFGKTTDFMTHRILFDKNIPGFENLTGLDQLPSLGAYVVALPMKIKDGSGAPLRIIAYVE